MKKVTDEKKDLRAGYKFLEYVVVSLTMLLAAVLIFVNSDDRLSDNFEIITASDNSESSVENMIVNLNTATVDQLISLDGIGEVKAKSIVKYREKHGSFKKKSEIMKVKGIGKATYKLIKDYIKV